LKNIQVDQKINNFVRHSKKWVKARLRLNNHPSVYPCVYLRVRSP